MDASVITLDEVNECLSCWSMANKGHFQEMYQQGPGWGSLSYIEAIKITHLEMIFRHEEHVFYG